MSPAETAAPPEAAATIPVPSAAAPADSLLAPALRAPTVGATMLISMIAFEAIAVAAVMPEIARSLDGLALYALAFGATLAASVVAMVAAGIDADRGGPRRGMAFGLGLFGLGLVLAGTAPAMGWLLLGRLAQGFGAGAIGVAIYVAAARLYPSALHPRLFALFAGAWVVPAVVGPGLAVLIAQAFGWRAVFLSVLPLLLLSAWMLLPALRAQIDRGARAARGGAALGWAVLAAGSALLLHLLAEQAAQPLSRGGLVLGLVLLGLAAQRLLPTGTLRSRRGLPSLILLRGLLASAFLSAEVFIPLWLSEQAQWSAVAAGLALTLGALSWSAGSALQARVGLALRQRVLSGGLAMTGLGIALPLAAVIGLLPAWTLLPAWILAGFGIGLAFPLISVLVLEQSPPQAQGRNSAALQLGEALLHSALLAVIGLGFAPLQAEHPAWAYGLVFALASGQCLLAAVLAGRSQP